MTLLLFLFFFLTVPPALSQKTIGVSEVFSSWSSGACQNILPSISLYKPDVADTNKRFTVLKFKDILIKDEVQIVSAYLFYKTVQPFTVFETQSLYIAPIDNRFSATCVNVEAIEDFAETVQPWLITEWEFGFFPQQTVGVSPNISMYITDLYGKNYPGKFSINFLVFWKETQSTSPLDMSSLELVINYRHYPGGKSFLIRCILYCFFLIIWWFDLKNLFINFFETRIEKFMAITEPTHVTDGYRRYEYKSPKMVSKNHGITFKWKTSHSTVYAFYAVNNVHYPISINYQGSYPNWITSRYILNNQKLAHLEVCRNIKGSCTVL